MIPAGCLRLPERYGARLWSMLAKGKAHKYVRRVPIPGKTTKTGKPRYRYYYHAAHGGGVGAHEHMVEGAAFQHDGGHWHIKDATGDKLRIEHDESKETRHVTRGELAGMLEAAHGKDLADYRAKVAARVKEARESGASAKQIAALEEHARRAGVSTGAGRPYVVGHGHDAPPTGAGPDNDQNPWVRDQEGKWHDENAIHAQQEKAWEGRRKVVSKMNEIASTHSGSRGLAEELIANRYQYEERMSDSDFADKHADPKQQTPPMNGAKRDILTRDEIVKFINDAKDSVGRDMADAPRVGQSLYDLALSAKHARYWAEDKRKKEALKPAMEALRVLESEALAPVTDADASAVVPSEKLSEVMGAIGSGSVVSSPVDFASGKNSRAEIHHSGWPGNDVPLAIHKDGKVIVGITSGVKRIRYHEDAAPLITGQIRPPKTAQEHAAIAAHILDDARTRASSRMRTAAEYSSGSDALALGMADREKIARAQKHLAALQAHVKLKTKTDAPTRVAPSSKAPTAPARRTTAEPTADALHERAARIGLRLERVGSNYAVTGNTYEHKDRIKAHGGKWDGANKRWLVPAASADKMVKGRRSILSPLTAALKELSR